MFDENAAGRLFAFFEGLLKFYREFLKVEQDKLRDLQAGRLDRLNARMKQEQARVLKARGLERERRGLLAELKAPEKRFRELIGLFPPQRREPMRALYGELSSVLLDLRETNRACNRLAKKKLARASVVLERLQNDPELRRIYSDKPGRETPAAGLLSKKI